MSDAAHENGRQPAAGQMNDGVMIRFVYTYQLEFGQSQRRFFAHASIIFNKSMQE